MSAVGAVQGSGIALCGRRGVEGECGWSNGTIEVERDIRPSEPKARASTSRRASRWS